MNSSLPHHSEVYHPGVASSPAHAQSGLEQSAALVLSEKAGPISISLIADDEAVRLGLEDLVAGQGMFRCIGSYATASQALAGMIGETPLVIGAGALTSGMRKTA